MTPVLISVFLAALFLRLSEKPGCPVLVSPFFGETGRGCEVQSKPEKTITKNPVEGEDAIEGTKLNCAGIARVQE
jgi:hypothetical protein